MQLDSCLNFLKGIPSSFPMYFLTHQFSLHNTTDLMDRLIILFGFFLMSQPGDCREKSPVLFAICWQLIGVRLFVWIFPFILVTTLFCCFGTFLLIFSKYKKWKDKNRLIAMLDTVPKYKYKTTQRDNMFGDVVIDPDGADCAICLAPYEEGTHIRILRCRHHYHMDCIDQWLCLTPSCPLCKRSIFPERGSDNRV